LNWHKDFVGNNSACCRTSVTLQFADFVEGSLILVESTNKLGKAINTSIIRMMTLSTQPPKNPASEPSRTPIMMAKVMVSMPICKDKREP